MPPSACLHAALVAALLAIHAGTPGTYAPRPEEPPQPLDFDRDAKPIFAKHCYSCHGPDKQSGDLRFDRKANALRGGDCGAAVAPGKAADSLLVKRVTEDNAENRMPPKGPGLSAAEVATLRRWIDEGAKWADDGSA